MKVSSNKVVIGRPPLWLSPFSWHWDSMGTRLETRRGRGHPKEKIPEWEGEARVQT
jgi:hypothetical protein